MIHDKNIINKVLLFHDVDISTRIGMQEPNSRYLMDWKKFKKIFELDESQTNTFEPLTINSSSYNFKAFTRITIDDGGGSCMEIAKFLKQKNIKAYFFIVTNFIGMPNFLCKDEYLMELSI